MTNSDCSWRWLFQSILSTHICVGGGTESACNVSTLYIILLIFDQEHIFKKLFLDYCFLFFLFFILFVLASRVTPVALLFARRTASGSWRVWRHGVPPTVRTCPMCTPACPSTCLGWTQRWQTEQMCHIEKKYLCHILKYLCHIQK